MRSKLPNCLQPLFSPATEDMTLDINTLNNHPAKTKDLPTRQCHAADATFVSTPAATEDHDTAKCPNDEPEKENTIVPEPPSDIFIALFDNPINELHELGEPYYKLFDIRHESKP
ncbi:hypothetical protein FOXG_10113 [Fusarium oxysporum f. sp. lycopersici 4287]|uniref:Uncharacterized protein n=3 Tax=Fusarium oxysporum TaxID=5507 RepID=A0A0J9VEX0_FUSO4|nr:hypothetical protein FOXG_10113 [Fusarium oxysporum f. sp. lycopersici 4287]EXK27572.1 hypothetical protein FOMG_15812 [Fusarium oxysporum f. sp. melonis 26406]KNB09558.1 hypothetical protein FOXG_10113 [Fusarium oxysporum f. sp. lycopersici 4287]